MAKLYADMTEEEREKKREYMRLYRKRPEVKDREKRYKSSNKYKEYLMFYRRRDRYKEYERIRRKNPDRELYKRDYMRDYMQKQDVKDIVKKARCIKRYTQSKLAFSKLSTTLQQVAESCTK